MTMATETQISRIVTEVLRSVARISLHNAPLNVIDLQMMDELAQAVSDIEGRSEISTIGISGHGSSFSAGVDVAAHTPDKVEAMLSKFHGVIRALVNTKKVTIAAVNGHCLGGGAELAMVCDLVYTTEDAQWGFPEIKLGCYPPVAVTALAALVGQKHAADLILTGRTISGSEAASIGLGNCRCAQLLVFGVLVMESRAPGRLRLGARCLVHRHLRSVGIADAGITD